MADYQKMYAVLCAAVDDVIGPLEKIPMAMQPVRTLREALLRAEDIYMDTSMYAEKNENVWDIARSYCTGAQAILAENDLDEEILSERRMLFIPLS